MGASPPLTAPRIAALRPRTSAYEIFDTAGTGLHVRILPASKTGQVRKVFRWRYRTATEEKTVTLGPFSRDQLPAHLTLAEARTWLARLQAAQGANQLDAAVLELRRHLSPPPTEPESGDVVKTVAEEFYLRRIVPHRKRPEVVRRILDLDILPVLGPRSVTSLTTRECAAAIERVVDRGATVHAGKVLGVLKQLLRFAQARGYTDRNPAFPLDPKDLGVEVNVTTRWLTAEEIQLLWQTLDREYSDPKPDKNGKVQRRPAMSKSTAAALKILLLTGVRSGELLKARWEHVDLNAATWTIPVENQKLNPDQARDAKPFVIPIAPGTDKLFRELQDCAGTSPWVMASDAEGGHFTDKALGRAMRRLFENKVPLLTLPGGPASPHDLRRTMRTHLGRLRIPFFVVEKCLNHSLGRIAETYDQGDYLDERREALEKWDAYVKRLVTGESTIAFLPVKEVR